MSKLITCQFKTTCLFSKGFDLCRFHCMYDWLQRQIFQGQSIMHF